MEARSLEESRLNAIRAAVAERELESVQDRLRREYAAERRRDRREVLRQFIPVLDNLERALATPSGDDQSLRDGVELVRRQFLSTLADYGVEAIDTDYAEFDPAEHEAIATRSVANPALDGIVVGVARKGYRIGDDILRPAQVVVGAVDRGAK